MSPFEDITSFPAVSFIKYSMPKQIDSSTGKGNHSSKPILVSSCTVTNTEPKRVSSVANEKSLPRHHRTSSFRYESTNISRDSKLKEETSKAYYHLRSSEKIQSPPGHSRHPSSGDASTDNPSERLYSMYNGYGGSSNGYNTNNSFKNKDYQYYKRHDYEKLTNRKSTPTHRKIDSDEVIKVSKMKLKPENSKCNYNLFIK